MCRRMHGSYALALLSALVLVLQPSCGGGGFFPDEGDFVFGPIVPPCETEPYARMTYTNESEDITYKVFLNGERIEDRHWNRPRVEPRPQLDFTLQGVKSRYDRSGLVEARSSSGVRHDEQRQGCQKENLDSGFLGHVVPFVSAARS